MRDDDDFDGDELDSDQPSGRLLHSGINPHPERAEYAVPFGEPALQDGDIEFELPGSESVAESRLTRRRALALGLGAGFLSASGLFWGLSSHGFGAVRKAEVPSSNPVDPNDEREVAAMLRLAHKFVSGPFERLIDNHATFIWIVDQYGGDDPGLMVGLAKLTKFALLDRGERGASIAKHVVRAYGLEVPPDALREHFLDLEDLLREWQARKR